MSHLPGSLDTPYWGEFLTGGAFHAVGHDELRIRATIA